MHLIILALFAAAAILAGVDLVRSHGESLTSWAALMLAVGLLLIQVV